LFALGTTARTHSTLLRAGCDAPYLFANADVSDHNWPFLARGLVALEQTPVEAAPKAFGAANEEMQATRLFGYRSGQALPLQSKQKAATR
jgi:hypothetical protein